MNENICPICMENNPEYNTICNHTFHKECLDKWNKNSCPYCRQILYYNNYFIKHKTYSDMDGIGLLSTISIANNINYYSFLSITTDNLFVKNTFFFPDTIWNITKI